MTRDGPSDNLSFMSDEPSSTTTREVPVDTNEYPFPTRDSSGDPKGNSSISPLLEPVPVDFVSSFLTPIFVEITPSVEYEREANQEHEENFST